MYGGRVGCMHSTGMLSFKNGMIKFELEVPSLLLTLSLMTKCERIIRSKIKLN